MNTISIDDPKVRIAEGAVEGSRAGAISRSLRDVARKARSPADVWGPVNSNQRRWQRSIILGTLIGFIGLVLLPGLGSAIYLAFVISDQYVSEARFAVRGGERSALDNIGSLTGLPSTQRNQDALIVSEYIHSRAMVEEIDRAINLRERYSRPGVDYLSRFDPKDSIEELVLYWRRRVDVSIDSMSGIITVAVRAFTQVDALETAQKIIVLSERLVNELSDRSRRDALRLAQAELNRAEAHLQDKILAFRDLRNVEGVLDADKTAEVMTKMVGELRLQLARSEQEYAAQRQSVAPTAPQLRVLEARIGSMREQVRRLETQMATTSAPKATALANTMGQFERLKLDRDIAEKRYMAAVGAYERARMELETQQVYITSFLRPVLAEEALHPKRWWIWSIIMTIALLTWGGGISMAVLVRNHIAV